MNKLAIVGTHPDTRDLAPFNDPTYDIWVFNEAPQADWCKRWDACFQMHKPEVYTSPDNMVRADHWDWLQQNHGGRVIWMQERDDRVPNSERYPLDLVTIGFPDMLKWFDLSASYAMALALALGYKEIAIYGMDLVSNTEYTYQLGNWRFWVGVAIGRGVTLDFHCEAGDFGNGHLYGYDGETQIERSYFESRAAELNTAWLAQDKELKTAKAKLFDCINGGKRYDKLPELAMQCAEVALSVGQTAGALAEAEKYARRDDPISRQQFERTSAAALIDAEDKRQLMYVIMGKIEYVWNIMMQTNNFEAVKQMRIFAQSYIDAAYHTGASMGIGRENGNYMNEVDALWTAHSGKKLHKMEER